MIAQSPLCPARVRKMTGSCALLEHRFIRHGFWTRLPHHTLLLYLFLVLVADRNGLSYYRFEKICALLQLALDDYLSARNALIKKDLMAFDGPLLQVLSLPATPVLEPASPRHRTQHMAHADPATIRHSIRDSLGADHDGPTHELRVAPSRPCRPVGAHNRPGPRSSPTNPQPISGRSHPPPAAAPQAPSA